MSANKKIQLTIQDINFELFVYENETLSNQLTEKGFHSQNDIDIIKKFCKEGDTVLDLGANIGWYSIIAAMLVKNAGKVIAFEADSKNAKMLQSNIDLNMLNNIQVVQKAVLDYDGHVEFYHNPENYGDHSIAQNTFKRCFNIDPTFSVGQKIESICLDNFLTKEEFSKVSFIKMDIQGSEVKALKGMSTLLQSSRPVILLEYAPAHLYDAKSSAFEIFAFIENYNYRPYKITANGKDPCTLDNYRIDEMFVDTFKFKQTYTGIDLLLEPIGD